MRVKFVENLKKIKEFIANALGIITVVAGMVFGGLQYYEKKLKYDIGHIEYTPEERQKVEDWIIWYSDVHAGFPLMKEYKSGDWLRASWVVGLRPVCDEKHYAVFNNEYDQWKGITFASFAFPEDITIYGKPKERYHRGFTDKRTIAFKSDTGIKLPYFLQNGEHKLFYTYEFLNCKDKLAKLLHGRKIQANKPVLFTIKND